MKSDVLTRPRARPSRTERLTKAKQLLIKLRDEGQYWLDHRPNGYDDTDDNAERAEKVETFTEELTNILDYVDQLEVPRFATRAGSEG